MEIAPTDPALIQFTGGTTGIPKGAVLTHANLVAATLQVSLWGGLQKPGKYDLADKPGLIPARPDRGRAPFTWGCHFTRASQTTPQWFLMQDVFCTDVLFAQVFNRLNSMRLT